MGPAGWNRLSACAAEFLAVHPYFNHDIPTEETPPPTIELISSPGYPTGSTSVPVRLKVSDSDGIHQVILFAQVGLKLCKVLNGEQEATVEFDYDGIISPATDPNRIGTSLSSPLVHSIGVEAVDIKGDVGYTSFELFDVATQKNVGTLEGHTAEVTSVAFSPDGTILASGSEDRTVKLWDVATQKNAGALEGHTAGVTSVAFSPDGTILVSGSWDKTVKLWDVATQKNAGALEGHTAGVISVAFSPDGIILVSGGGDKTVKLWDVATQKNAGTLEGHTAGVTSVAFSPDGAMLASGGGDGDRTVKLWDVATQKNIATFGGEVGSAVSAMAFSPNRNTLAFGGGFSWINIELWDVATQKSIGTLEGHRSNITSIVYSPDGTLLASGSFDSTIKLWDVATRHNIITFKGKSGGNLLPVAFSPDGRTLVSGSFDGTILFWDTAPFVTETQINVLDLVLIAESQRPPLYWVDTQAGTLHNLIGAKVEHLLKSVQNATSLAVDMVNGKLYWAEKTSDRTGKIRRANFDGSDVKLVKDLTSVPLDIALDTVAGKLYLTNSWGKLQRMNLDGSNFQPNLITGLQSPKHLTLDVTRDKIYWTEQTSDKKGKIRCANLEGSNLELVKNLMSVPQGLAADLTNNRLYVTNSWDKIQHLDFDGSNFVPNFITDFDVSAGNCRGCERR